MLKKSDIIASVIDIDADMEFDYGKEHFWLSACDAPDGKVRLFGPHNDDIVDQDIDVILDTLLVDGKPLRDMIHLID